MIIIIRYETTAATLSFALALLARHPEAAAKLVAEVQAQAAPAPAPASADAFDLEKTFPYASAVISETLRLYPPGNAVLREAKTACELGGYALPKGALVVISIYDLHRDPEYWSDPDAFKPERFLGPEPEPKVPGAFLPFGGGLRSCPGNRFAMQEARLALVRLFERFTFELPPGMDGPIEVQQGITLSAKGGVPLYVRRRAD